MDDNVTCTEESWWATDVKTDTHKPKPAPFDQEFYLVLNVVRDQGMDRTDPLLGPEHGPFGMGHDSQYYRLQNGNSGCAENIFIVGVV